MRIPSDIQVQTPPSRSGVLEALGLKIGQAVTASVVSQNPNGSTLLQFGNQQLSLNLPQQFPQGQILQFEVLSGGARPQLALLTAGQQVALPQAGTQALPQLLDVLPATISLSAQQTQTGQPTQTAPQPSASNGQPLAQNALQPASTQGATAQAGAGNSASSQPPGTAGATQLQVSGNTAQAPAAAAPAASATTQATSSGPASTGLSTQTTLTLPPNVQSALNLAPGQSVAVKVAPPTLSGQPQVTIGGQTFTAQLPGNPPPGTAFQGQSQPGGAQLALSLQTPRQGAVPYPVSARPIANMASNTTQQPNLVAANAQPLSLAQVAGQSVAQQDSVGKLIASIAGLGRATQNALPSNITNLFQKVENLTLKLDQKAPGAEQLKQAVAQSGVFLEAGLARGLLPPGGAQGDMKGLLLLLKNTLGEWLGEGAGAQKPAHQPAPPVRGMLPRADAQNPLPLPGDISAKETARQLLSQTDHALSRLRLFQLSSLPDAGQRGNMAAPQELHFELPFVLGQETRMAQFQITRDGHQTGDIAERGWQLAFSLYFNAIGSVGAKISFRSRKTSALIWAENEETAEVMEEALPELVQSLNAIGLDVGSVRIRHQPPKEPAPHTGEFVDSTS